MERSLLPLLATLLRDPRAALDAAADPETLSWMVPRLLGVLAVGGAVFGGVVGAYRGGIQIPYAALKMPLLLVIPLAVGLPAVRALFSTEERAVPWTRLAVAGLIGATRTAILAAAASPFLWLLWSVVTDYHLATLTLALALGALGLQGLAAVRHALPRVGLRDLGAIAVAVGLLGLTTAQTGWLLRPFVARPTAEVAFLRPIEADIASSLAQTAKSSGRHYDGWEAERSGLLGRGLDRSRGE